MARATNNTKTETITQTTGTVELSLSLFEARFLLQILDHVGGDPAVSARKHANAIREALFRTGLKSSEYRRSSNSGSIYFADEAEVLRGER